MALANLLDQVRKEAHDRAAYGLTVALLRFKKNPDLKSTIKEFSDYWVSGKISLEIDRLSENSWKLTVVHSHYGFEIYDLCGLHLGDCSHDERLESMLPEVHKLIDKVTAPLRVGYELASSIGYVEFLAKSMGLPPLRDIPSDFDPGLT